MLMMLLFNVDEIVKHVDFIKVSDKPTIETSLETSGVGDHRFRITL